MPETLNNFLNELNNVDPMTKLTWVISEKFADFLDLHIFRDFNFKCTGIARPLGRGPGLGQKLFEPNFPVVLFVLLKIYNKISELATNFAVCFRYIFYLLPCKFIDLLVERKYFFLLWFAKNPCVKTGDGGWTSGPKSLLVLFRKSGLEPSVQST